MVERGLAIAGARDLAVSLALQEIREVRKRSEMRGVEIEHREVAALCRRILAGRVEGASALESGIDVIVRHREGLCPRSRGTPFGSSRLTRRAQHEGRSDERHSGRDDN